MHRADIDVSSLATQNPSVNFVDSLTQIDGVDSHAKDVDARG
jgi:hypothetical protein